MLLNLTATVLVSIAAVCVSAAAVLVSWLQLAIAKRKLRMELYDKRFAVLQAVSKYQRSVANLETTQNEMKSTRDAVWWAYGEADYLFGSGSGVTHCIGELLRLGDIAYEVNQLIGPTGVADAATRNDFAFKLHPVRKEYQNLRYILKDYLDLSKIV